MEKHNEAEITSLLATIRSNRDMGSFAQTPKKGQKADKSKDVIPPILEKKQEPKAENTEGVSQIAPPKKERLKPAITNEEATELSKFFQTIQAAEAGELYTYAQNKRYYVDDTLFQTLVLLKNAGRVRNISVMINTIVAAFLETHQGDIDELLQQKKRK
jgi:hypothetical protein